MSRKIGFIVEGITDKKFFDDHFKKQFPDFRGIKVIPSGTGNTCKIQNEGKIKSKIEDLKDIGCSQIYILIDLNSKCKKEIYDCVVELKNDYVEKMKILDESVNVVVVSSEIEAWMLSSLKKSDKKRKEDLQKELKVESSANIEEVLLKKFISLKKEIDYKNNESLCYFLKKLGVVGKEVKCK